jgi:hypothetical protein
VIWAGAGSEGKKTILRQRAETPGRIGSARCLADVKYQTENHLDLNDVSRNLQEPLAFVDFKKDRMPKLAPERLSESWLPNRTSKFVSQADLLCGVVADQRTPENFSKIEERQRALGSDGNSPVFPHVLFNATFGGALDVLDSARRIQRRKPSLHNGQRESQPHGPLGRA